VVATVLQYDPVAVQGIYFLRWGFVLWEFCDCCRPVKDLPGVKTLSWAGRVVARASSGLFVFFARQQINSDGNAPSPPRARADACTRCSDVAARYS
jgi:hypothetical protein